MKGLAAPLFSEVVWLSRKRKEKMRENKKASVVSFTGYQLNNYKVISGLFSNTKPLTNYKNLQLITLLHEEKVGKIKNQKVKVGRFVGVAKICSPCKISQGCEKSHPLGI